MPGSSPHTRGTPCNSAWRNPDRRDHPRIRGEHAYAQYEQLAGGGIIPAYAGNTSSPRSPLGPCRGSSPHTRGTRGRAPRRCPSSRDHPRIRGEHAWKTLIPQPNQGIIPAYAGNTVIDLIKPTISCGSSPHTRGTPRQAWASCRPCRDHPRIRGEHSINQCAAIVDYGIIPAYAGNTWCGGSRNHQSWGSSPHTRGTPASASCRTIAKGDHPRIRGEHTYLPAIPIPGVAVLYHFIQSDGPCASYLHRSSLTSWLHSSSHLRNRSASPSKPNHRNPWASSWIDEHEMQHAAHYWPNRPLSPCHH